MVCTGDGGDAARAEGIQIDFDADGVIALAEPREGLSTMMGVFVSTLMSFYISTEFLNAMIMQHVPTRVSTPTHI